MRTQTRRAATLGTKTTARVRSKDSDIAAAVKELVLAGDREAAREKFSDLVATQQRRAVRIAYHYLRDAYDADEAVQDAFVKVFTHITTYREDLPFEVWFTRILVNACLDIGKARARRLRWVMPVSAQSELPGPDPVALQPGPEARLISSERAGQIAGDKAIHHVQLTNIARRGEQIDHPKFEDRVLQPLGLHFGDRDLWNQGAAP